MPCVTFSAWPLSLNIIFSSFTCVQSELHSFLRLNGIPLCSYTTGHCCLAIAALGGVLFSRFSDVRHQWDSQAKATLLRGSLCMPLFLDISTSIYFGIRSGGPRNSLVQALTCLCVSLMPYGMSCGWGFKDFPSCGENLRHSESVFTEEYLWNVSARDDFLDLSPLSMCQKTDQVLAVYVCVIKLSYFELKWSKREKC